MHFPPVYKRLAAILFTATKARGKVVTALRSKVLH